MIGTAAGQDALFAWDAGGAELVPASKPWGEPDVVDSWLVADGLARGTALHAARFSAACAIRHGVAESVTAPFLAGVLRSLPTTGRWFPRVELALDAGEPALRLRLRSAPEAVRSARLWVDDRPDPRREPRIKGPDLAALHAVRDRARRAGADEAVLLGPAGEVREGAFSALLWWRADTLCTTSPEAPILDSVTRRLLVELAAGSGHDVRFEVVTPADLDGLEVWSVSALHGIRAVTGWSGQPFAPAPAARAAEWNARVDRTLVPLPGCPGR